MVSAGFCKMETLAALGKLLWRESDDFEAHYEGQRQFRRGRKALQDLLREGFGSCISVFNELSFILPTLYKGKLEMDHRPKYKTENNTPSRRKYRRKFL